MTPEEITHYEILGIPRSANSAEIWQAHRDRLAEADTDGEIEQIEQAYAILSDPGKRQRYDIDLHIQARMREGSTRPAPSSETPASPPRKTSAGQYSRTLPPHVEAPPQRFFGPWSKRVPTTTLGWVIFLTSLSIGIIGLIADFDGGSDAGSDFVSDYLTTDAGRERAIIDAWEAQKATLTAYPTLRPLSVDSVQLEPEKYYDLGLEMLERSSAPCDSAERSALISFSVATTADDEYAPAYRSIGIIQYHCWREGIHESYKELARESLSQYVRLADGDGNIEVDDEVRSILDALE